ncbi:MAG: hypothetical protein GTO49_32090 [Anaerolineae bacterium]|nr:hypothetical protein [Anaerolineae bacterium]
MSPQTIRILIAGALFVHAVGHTLGFWMPARSWLLPNLPESTLRIISSIFWILASIGFLASLLGFLGIVVPVEWWRSIAVVFAFVSLLGLLLFWSTWPAFNTIGAISMNLAVLVTQLWLRWPPVSLFGR